MNYRIVQVKNEEELQKAFSIRETVFIEEQQVPKDIELDEYDHDAKTVHLLAVDDHEQIVGTARFRPYGNEGVCKVERVAVLSSLRGAGVGRMLMEEIHRLARELGYHTALLNAQLHAKRFYERLGYEGKGDIFLEAGIEHITMTKSLAS